MSASTESARPSAGEPDSEGGQQPENGGRSPRPDTHPAEAFRQAFAKVHELREFAAYYATARLDLIRVTIRNLGIYAALAILLLVAVAAMAVTGIVLLLRGMSGALAEVFWRHPWLGDLITAVIVLVALAVGVVFAMKRLTRTFRSLTVQKYEDRQRRERQQFGRDVHQQAESVERIPR